MAIVEKPTEDFIGKKVICGIYLEGEQKKYGVVESFTENTISVKINGSNKIIEYSYEDIDLDFQTTEDY